MGVLPGGVGCRVLGSAARAFSFRAPQVSMEHLWCKCDMMLSIIRLFTPYHKEQLTKTLTELEAFLGILGTI